MHEKFLKPYDPTACEDAIYHTWEESGFFNPDVCIEKGVTDKKAETFSIVLPPPNVTGVLHTGHAAMLAVEDILVRYHRMKGDRTLWIPGTDHAAIATQSKVEKILQKDEKRSRHDLGREEFLTRVRAFAQDSHDTIVHQVRKMGSSLDWSREAFTLDEPRHKAVNEAFKRLYDLGLIVRGHRIVNWDPKGQTVISDDEIVYEERTAQFYTFKYSKDFPITISTTRPETKVGDTAVAVHPDDARYKQYVGTEYDAVFCDVPIHIKIIADTAVDPAFGTGALGVTPAHSLIDYEMSERHQLEVKQVINEYAKMTVEGRLKDKKVGEARELVVAWLKEEGLLEKEETVPQNVSNAERTGAIIEPLPKLQWFVAVNKPFVLEHSNIPGIESGSETTLKEIMRKSVESGAISITPDRFEKIYYHWIDNLRDWCISRQIWYGHQIPAWHDISDQKNQHGMLHYKSGSMYDMLGEKYSELATLAHENQNIEASWAEINGVRIINFAMAKLIHEKWDIGWDEIKVEAQPHTHNLKNSEIVLSDANQVLESYIQDPDTLDTWFSSGLWTFSTLGWPEQTKDLATYHPTAVLETGYDILFFWIARMILMSGALVGDVPFKAVYLHGLVRDEKGRKMSKSLGNALDPVILVEKYGADATRLALIIGAAAGNDIKLSEQRVKGYKNFSNKLWNIARFVLTSVDESRLDLRTPLHADDQALLDELQTLASDITDDFEHYRLYLAGEKLYHYSWDRFAAEIIEVSKPIVQGDTETSERKASRVRTLYELLVTQLKLLHPFMPFVTEEIWSALPEKESELLMVAKWPTRV